MCNGRGRYAKEKKEIVERVNQALQKEQDNLQKINRFMIDREVVMSDLKKEVNKLLEELNRPKKYGE